MKYGVLIFMLLALGLTGCSMTVEAEYGPPVVEQVVIEQQGLMGSQVRQSRDPVVMSQVMNYLRMTRCQHPALVDPATTAGNSYTIRILLSNGQERLYYQRGDACFARGDGPWMALRPTHGQYLQALFQGMEAETGAMVTIAPVFLFQYKSDRRKAAILLHFSLLPITSQKSTLVFSEE